MFLASQHVHMCPHVPTDIPTIFQRGEELMKGEMLYHLSFRDKILQYILHVPPKVLNGIKPHLPTVERTSKIQPLLTPFSASHFSLQLPRIMLQINHLCLSPYCRLCLQRNPKQSPYFSLL